MAGTLYTYPESFRAYKAQIAAKYSESKLEVPEFKLGVTNKTPEFLTKFPLGKVPAYESKDGVLLFESNAIAYYLSTEAMRGANAADAAAIQQWMSFGDSEVTPASCTWVYPCLGIMQFNKQNTERAKTELKQALAVLNEFLSTRTYLVGERISLADVCLCCNLLALYTMVLEPEFRQPYANVNRWFTTLVNQPQFKAVIGEVKLCEKMAQFDAKKYQELHGQAKPEKKKPEKKVAEKPKPKPEPMEDDDPPAEKPSRDPFGAFPVGTFVMDDWKKVYSNEDTAAVAVPYFWKNFDKENYSIWYSEYKYPEDLKMIFMSCNLVSGMFQRLDRMRKHAFGSAVVFGENNNSTISGVWIWRGHDLAFDLSPDLQIDYESYSWRKLDADSAETKTMVDEYFKWEGNFGGKKFSQGKIFK